MTFELVPYAPAGDALSPEKLLAGFGNEALIAICALMVIGIFAIAFSTFFGMPFISTAPHKGAI